MADGNVTNVLLMNLTKPAALKLIREIAEQSHRVRVTTHAEERMIKRGITRKQVMRCLAKGRIVEGPARGVRGNWEVKMEAYSAGDPVSVVGALDRDGDGNYFLVITVMR